MFTPFAFIKRQVSAAIQKILLVGNFNTFNTPIAYNGVKLISGSSQIDTTFNVGSGANNTTYTSTVDENGKILIGGAFTSYSGSAVNKLTRINTNGTRDTTFNVGTGITGLTATVYTTLPVTESKVLIGGAFSAYSGSTANYLTRVNSNGTQDTTFKGYTNSAVNTSATQSDGKIIIGGNFSILTYPAPQIAKLTTQGNLDYTFNPGVGTNGSVYTLASQSDGKIIMGGAFTTYSGSSSNRLVRVNTDGTIDTSFNVGVGFNGDVFVTRVQPDNKILIGGTFTSYSGSAAQNRIIRLNSNGTIDSTFIKGTGFNTGTVYDLQLQSDSKIIAVGSWTLTYSGSSAIRIARINTSGSLDTTFNSGTTGFSANQYSTQIQNDGKIIVVGTNATYSGSAAQRIRRINTDGTLDTTFNIGPAGLNNTANIAKIQPDQKIVVMGSFTSYSGSAVNRITRINTDGTRDLTFNVGTGFNSVTAIPSALELDSSGNVYAGSTFTTYSGSNVNYIVKINPSGSISTGIKTGGSDGVNNFTNALLIDSTGSVYAGGGFNLYSSTAVRIARLNADGGKDYTFNPGGGFNNVVYSLKVQPDNKIVVGGAFTSYSGSSNNYIARVNTDGTRDNSFNVGSGFDGSVYKLALENTGKILALGNFTTYSGSSVPYLARLNISGTLDRTFSTSSNFPTNTQACDLLSDISGSVHVAYPEPPSYAYLSGYSKLTSSGSYDYNTLITTTAISNTVNSLASDSSNNVFVLGYAFTASMNTNTNIIAFNNSSNTTSSLFNPGTGFFSTGFNTFTGFPKVSTKLTSGDILIAGNFTAYSGSSTNLASFIKINQQGNLLVTSSNFNTGITSLSEQSDGKILVGFTNNSGDGPIMYRFNSNGTFDSTFNQTETYFYSPLSVKQQSSGNILMGGDFYTSQFDGESYIFTTPQFLTRLDSSGSQIALNYTPDSPVYNINLLPDDSFIITGASDFVKLDPTGSIITSYNVGTKFSDIVYTSTLQSDGKLIAAGAFTTYSGSTANRLARINTDGTLDTTFNPGAGFNIFNTLNSKIVVDNSGNIHVAGGGFTSYSGSAISGYVKILPNGNIDPTGTSGSFSVGQPYTIELLD